jgi:hypothetical protein
MIYIIMLFVQIHMCHLIQATSHLFRCAGADLCVISWIGIDFYEEP